MPSINRLRRSAGFLPILAVLLSCTDAPAPTAPPEVLDVLGTARLLPLSGTLLRLGSSDPQAGPDEAPGWTRFQHDIWMDTTEVTQAEFRRMLGYNLATTQGDSLPLTNASWYDAVYFANMRSKVDALDTVYEYTSIVADPKGNIWDLKALTIHYERNGWRLPTEAEWEAAARAGTTTPYLWGAIADSSSADRFAWSVQNSDGTVHPVATKLPNAWGLYDMAGNAMEWVADWKGPFPRDTAADYAGLDAPGDIPEIPLKGGAFAYGRSNLRPSSRTGTYAAYRSSRTDYVGFRLVRGAFAPTFSSPGGRTVSAPAISIDLPNIGSVLGSASAKLVFVNRSNGTGILSWIDFSEPSPSVRTLPDRSPVFHPAISPDGNWVAWCTALEGSTGPSRIRARRLDRNDTLVLDLGEGAIPRWSIQGSDTFLVRAGALDNTAAGWSGTTTTARKWTSSGSLAGGEATWAQGSFHDGRSGPFLYTGFRRLLQYDTRTGTSRTLFTSPRNGKSENGSTQVCNASAAPDASGRVLFLDFGYSGVSTVTQGSYGIHQVAFVADSAGNIAKQIPVPPAELQWDHLEWSNHPRWAVSSVLDASEAAHAVMLLDLQTGTSSRIIHGNDLWQPALWTATALGKGPTDSAGLYTTKIDSSRMNILGDGALDEYAAKMDLFWQRKDSIEILLVGSSRVKMGLLPDLVRSGTAFNAGVGGQETVGDVDFVRNYALVHCPRLKVVCIGFMPYWFSRWDGSDTGVIKLLADIRNTQGRRYDENHGFWAGGFPPSFLATTWARRPTATNTFFADGGIHMPAGTWSTSPNLPWDPTTEFAETPAFRSNLQLLEALADELQRKGVLLLLVNMPVNPNYRNTPFAEPYGVRWNVYDSLMARMRVFESSRPNVRFYDAYNGGVNDFQQGDGLDDGHLSSQGAVRLTPRVDSVIADMLRTAAPTAP